MAATTHTDGIPLAKPTENDHSSSSVKSLPASFYDQFLSITAKERKPSPIRGLFPLEKTPGVISLLAGKPNASTFPFTSFNFTAQDPNDPSKQTSVSIPQDSLAAGLQYGDTSGMPNLLRWITGLQEKVHGRKQGEGWRVSMGAGSQDLIYKAVSAMVNPGDSVFVESPVYAGVIPMFQNLHCKMVEVETDAKGIRSSSLRQILESWPAGEPKPKVLYTVPYGCNPTGMTAALDRRKEVLKLAHEHNFIILEDDPYYYLYYGTGARNPSYFALELEEAEVGRVLRFDSLSKILSAGIRIGFASGPETLLNAIDRHTATANLQVSSLTQLITYELLNSWGYDAFITHTQKVSEFYRQKRDVFEAALNKYLKEEGLAEWETPEAGMFFWFKLILSPPSSSLSSQDKEEKGEAEQDSRTLIETRAFANGVLALPGTVFLPNGSEGGRKTAYVRASFSLLGEEEVGEAVRRLRRTLIEAREEAEAEGGEKGE